MLMSWHENAFPITGPLWGESTGNLGFPAQRAINPLHAKFFKVNINIYLHFVSFLHIDTTQVVEIRPQIRQEPTYFT